MLTPVSSSATLVAPDTVSPRTPGSEVVITKLTKTGASTIIG